MTPNVSHATADVGSYLRTIATAGRMLEGEVEVRVSTLGVTKWKSRWLVAEDRSLLVYKSREAVGAEPEEAILLVDSTLVEDASLKVKQPCVFEVGPMVPRWYCACVVGTIF